MYFILNKLVAEVSCRSWRGQGTRLGRKVLCLCILILLVVPFQLSGPLLQESFAAERLPVVMLDDMKGKPAFESLVHAIQSAGFAPRTIREEDFAFNITPRTASAIVVPVGSHVSPEAVTMLSRYMATGGRVILIPADTDQEARDTSVLRLFAAAGLPVSGITHTPQRLSFNWKGLLLNTGEHLPKATPVLAIQPNEQMEILATWGSDLPAIATTGKGAVLNWQWGKELSEVSNIVALSKVMAPGKGEPLIMLQQDEVLGNKSQPKPAATHAAEPIRPQTAPNGGLFAERAKPSTASVIALPPSTPPASILSSIPAASTPSSMAPSAGPQTPQANASAPADSPKSLNGSTLLPPTKQSASVSSQTGPANHVFPKSHAGHSASGAVRALQPIAQAPPALVKTPVSPPLVSSPASTSVAVEPVKPQPAITETPAAKAVPAAKTTPTAGPANVDSRDTEVLNNILGIPSSESVKAGTAPTTPDPKGGEAQQKHFSFLDPEAASVLAPAFDYGVYSLNLRKLDDYKRRVRDALEAGRQLSLDIPETQVNALLKESDLHKRKFESLYLAGQTQQGLDENTLARRAALQALALTTISPQVEGRAIWLDRGSIIATGGPEGLKKRIQQLHKAGINIVYFETVNAGFPIYPSKLVKRNPMVNGWDPLQVAVEEGHKQGMEVHAWVWCFAVGNRRHNAIINQPDDYAGPILTEGGMMGEALRNQGGGLSVDSHQHEFWLSPASPKARDFLVNLYKEIVTHYDVDGLQLDYIRYPFQTPGNRMGFEAAGREHFAQATGKSLDSLDDYTLRVWTAWKTYQVSSFVQQVSTALKKIKPELKLSAAVFPMHRDARIAMIQQDWETWIDNGWIDTLSPMSYTSDPDRLQEMFDYVQHSPRKHTLVYPGIALHRLDGGQLVQHLEAVRQRGGLGSTLFAGSHLDDDKANTLAAGPYKLTGSMPPHQDVVKSLQAIVADYQAKLGILRQKGVLKGVSIQQMDTLQTSLQQFSEALDALGSGRHMASLSPQKLKTAQQRLNELNVLSQNWSSADKATHPYRAQYFERDMTLMSEILGYTLDKLGLSFPDKPMPTAPAPVATTIKTQPTGMLGTVVVPEQDPTVSNFKPSADPAP
jgi:uncharacterized lipoprotein YddW (UPF0748 family)